MLTAAWQDPDLEGDPVDRRRLEQLHPERFSSILILADDSASVAATVGKNLEPASIADADSRCLASLLLLRDIQSTRMPMGHSRLSCAPPSLMLYSSIKYCARCRAAACWQQNGPAVACLWHDHTCTCMSWSGAHRLSISAAKLGAMQCCSLIQPADVCTFWKQQPAMPSAATSVFVLACLHRHFHAC